MAAEKQPPNSKSDRATIGEATAEDGELQHQNPPPPPREPLQCPRCDSMNTKFCYYNNYSFLQPRHYCKTCQRYWTKGGVIRNVPVGGRSRKPKRPRNDSSSSSVGFSTVGGMSIPTISDHRPPPSISLPLSQNRVQQQQYFLNNANAGGIGSLIQPNRYGMGGNDGTRYRGLQLPPIQPPLSNRGIPTGQQPMVDLHRQLSSIRGPNQEYLNYQPATGLEDASRPAPFMMPAGGNGSGFLTSPMMMGSCGSSSTVSDTHLYNRPQRCANVNLISPAVMTSTTSTATAAATGVGELEENNELMLWQKDL